MFRRKKKEETGAETAAEIAPGTAAEGSAPESPVAPSSAPAIEATSSETSTGVTAPAAATSAAVKVSGRGNRVQKVGTVSSDKMQKTVVVRVDRLVRHRKYRRYVRRTSKFMAHDELGASTGDRVRIVETRPQSAHKRWRVVEILQKAAK